MGPRFSTYLCKLPFRKDLHTYFISSIIINKCELAPETAKELIDIYSRAGFPAFAVSAKEKWGEIVDILNIIDAQYSLYNDKLSFLKRQRKALQQYLLNGIVRVK